MSSMELLVSQASVEGIQGWLQLATSGGFAALVWYLLAVRLPEMQKRFDNQSDAAMEAYRAESYAAREAHERVIQAVIDQHERHYERILSLAKRTGFPQEE